jgi:non-ribosomal peptide synthetase component F
MADRPEDDPPPPFAPDSTGSPVNDREPHCLHELFEAQVARTPDKVAIIFGRERVSYRELDHRANRLARHLRKSGVGPEVPVAVCLERTPDLVVSLLAVLKAGGAYLPLDPRYPRERLRYMLEDSSPAAIITSAGRADDLPGQGAHVLLVGGEDLLEEGGRLSSDVGPANVAYLI